jgi:hypothetical protein
MKYLVCGRQELLIELLVEAESPEDAAEVFMCGGYMSDDAIVCEGDVNVESVEQAP